MLSILGRLLWPQDLPQQNVYEKSGGEGREGGAGPRVLDVYITEGNEQPI